MAWLDLHTEIAEEMAEFCSARLRDIAGLSVRAVRGDRDEELFNRKFKRRLAQVQRERAKPQLKPPGIR